VQTTAHLQKCDERKTSGRDIRDGADATYMHKDVNVDNCFNYYFVLVLIGLILKKADKVIKIRNDLAICRSSLRCSCMYTVGGMRFNISVCVISFE